MKFQTMSLVAGTAACNARCPFCVSKMTGNFCATDMPEQKLNYRNLDKAIQLAQAGGVTNVIITGKGEPLLYPGQVYDYMMKLDNMFPFVELQTNGIVIERGLLNGWNGSVASYLKALYDFGLTTIAISNCGFDAELNDKIYTPHLEGKWIDLKKVVDRIHDAGLVVRYTTVGIKDGIDTVEKLERLAEFCKTMGIDQLSWRPVAQTSDANTENADVNEWVKENGISKFTSAGMARWVEENATKLYDLVHGAAVFDLDGQNLCMTNCLTRDTNEEVVRQLIFMPNGQLSTDWELKGSRLL